MLYVFLLVCIEELVKYARIICLSPDDFVSGVLVVQSKYVWGTVKISLIFV